MGYNQHFLDVPRQNGSLPKTCGDKFERVVVEVSFLCFRFLAGIIGARDTSWLVACRSWLVKGNVAFLPEAAIRIGQYHVGMKCRSE